MSEVKTDTNVWFVYDGDCPICNLAANSFQVKKTIGHLHLVNARFEETHPVVSEINEHLFDLDKGMVIKFNDRFYHGADALHVMAMIGTNRGWLNRINFLLFRSKILSKICYPVMRALRNVLLKIKGVKPIKNLKKSEPIFKSIFGDDWEKLPPVMHKHYANRGYSHDHVEVDGTMEISCSFAARLLTPFMLLFGALAPIPGKDIKTTVHFKSQPDNNRYHFHRIFKRTGKKPFHFRSYMEQISGNDVVEFMRFGLGWRMHYLWQDGKVILQNRGFVWRVFGKLIPLPLGLIMGEGYAEEEAIDDNIFRMYMDLTHPWWGKVYEYRGTFKVVHIETGEAHA